MRLHTLSTCFTPFTVRSFLMSASRRAVSIIITVRLPRKSPSCESMFMLLSTSFSSYEMMLVRLFTMPRSSLPMTRRVI